MVHSATRLEAILAAVVRERPAALVVDSIQTVFLEDATGRQDQYRKYESVRQRCFTPRRLRACLCSLSVT